MSESTDNSLMNVLIIAYACEPDRSSEPGVGWNMAHEISTFANVTVITRSNNRKVIESAPPNDRIRFEYVDFGTALKKLKKTALLGAQGYYFLWQWIAYRKAKELAQKYTYDLLHHVTFGVSWISPPVFVTRLPFVWGPIGGGDMLPLPVLAKLPLRNVLREAVYFLLKLMVFVSPFSAYARYRAKHIFFRSRSSVSSLPRRPAYPWSIMCETATDDAVVVKNNHATDECKVQFLAIGRMTYWKGFNNAVSGFVNYLKAGGKATLVILGDGPEFFSLRKFVRDNGVADRILFKGNVPHDQVETELRVSDVLLHPSFRDGGSWAIMEGMMYGLPAVCLNISGPADMVSEQTGILLDPHENGKIIHELEQAVQLLATNHELRKKLSRNAQERIELHYRWKQRGQVLKAVYNKVISINPSDP
jgi:glycosyltransferase involved in cell wall biosynthesis